MKCVTIKFSYIKESPALLGSPPFVLFGENCMSADRTNEKRGRRAEPSRAENERNAAEFDIDVLNYAIEKWRGKSGGRSLISVSTTSLKFKPALCQRVEHS